MAPTPQRPRTAVAIRDPLPWAQLREVVGTVEEVGYDGLFLPEISGREAFSTLAALAGRTSGLRLATGVVTIGSRRVLTTAMAAATVHEVSGGRHVLGIGSGPAGAGALDRLRTYVEALRALFAGQRVDRPDGGGRLALVPSSPIPVWLAALGPRAMRLAGEVADGVLLNWCPPERVAIAREQVRAGAESAGRDPDAVTIAVYVRASVGQDGDALVALKAAAGSYAAAPAYRRQFELVGLGAEAEAAAAAHAAGRPGDVPERLVRAVTLPGDAAAARQGIQAYRDAGADLPIVYPVPARERESSLLGTLFALAPDPGLRP